MTEERSPVCGAVAEHHDDDHRKAYATPQDVATACGAEAEKIQILTRELATTIHANEEEITQVGDRLRGHEAQMNEAQVRLREEMQPRVGQRLAEIRAAEQARTRLTTIADLHGRRERALEDAQVRRGADP